MKPNKKLLIVMTAAGVFGATAVAGASGLVSKVTGALHKEIAVTVNGGDTSLHPVYIDGKAYLPARALATEMGYEVSWNQGGNAIEINQKAEEEKYMTGMGVIVDVQPADNGQYRIELLGRGGFSWVILFADKDTILTGSDGAAFAAKDLKPGMRVVAEFGPVMTMSFPGQSHARKISVVGESLVKEDVIQSVEKTDDGWQVKFGETKDGKAVTTLVVNAGKETGVLTSQGEPVEFASLKAGDKVRAYYGPIMTKSLPPQSPLHYLVVLPAAPSGKIDAATAQQYRELAWSKLSEDQKKHATTKSDEAVVQVVNANDGAIMAAEGAQKKLEALRAGNAVLFSVTYNTDQDELIGPLTVVLDPTSKEIVGYFARR
ncbi:stalk domain-containing protein [Cohnella suwonensis]|uniref:Stalk domain-containing protein n=1 Tax=Cohnella suwonensis TaxID=696072 RepID=A0ABW0LWT8_9BACL